MRHRFHALVVALALIAGCSESADSSAGAPSPSPTPSPTSSSNVIGPGGGTVTSAGVGSISIPAGRFTEDTTITFTTGSGPSMTDPDFSAQAALFDIAQLNPSSVRITLNLKQPADTVTVKLNVPSQFSGSLPAGERLVIISEIVGESDQDGPYPFWEPIVPTFAGTEASFSADPTMFSKALSSGQRYAHFVFATIRDGQ